MSKIFEALSRVKQTTGENGGVFGLEPEQIQAEAAQARFAATRANSSAPQEHAYTGRRDENLTLTVVAETHDHRRVDLQLPGDVPVLPFDGVDPSASEEYRILRTNLLYHPMQPRVIAVSSAGPGEGKTISAINAAGALALKSDIQVLLVDADLRRPAAARMLGVEASPGLGDVLAGEVALDEAIVRLQQLPNFHFLPVGRISSNPAEMLDSLAWRNLIGQLRRRFRITILDTTPVAAVADFDLVQAVSDGVMLVVRPDVTDRTQLEHALQVVPRAKLLGTLVNCAVKWGASPKSNYGKIA